MDNLKVQLIPEQERMIRRMLSLAVEQWLVLAVVTISPIVQSAGLSPTRDFHVSIQLQQTPDTRVANMRAENEVSKNSVLAQDSDSPNKRSIISLKMKPISFIEIPAFN